MRSSSTTAGDAPAKQALPQPAHQIEESVMDVYTTTEEYDGADDDDDDDSTTATRSPRADTRNPDQQARNPTRHSLPKDSYLSEFSMATEQVDDDDEEQSRQRFSSRDYTSYDGDEVSFAGYSISAALDAGTTLQQHQLPSFRRNNNNDRRRSESVTVGSSTSSFFLKPEQSASTIKTSHIFAVPNVQRIVTAPPGSVGPYLASRPRTGRP